MDTLAIEHNREQSRFEVTVEGHLGVLEYTLDNGVVNMNHTGVPEAVGGRGIAGQLTRHALDWAREQELKVNPRCPYVAAWIERHPEYRELLQ